MIRIIVPVIFFTFIAGFINAQVVVTPRVGDMLKPAAQAKIDGYIEGRLHASYENRILAQDVDRLIEPFRNRTETSCWQSEFWGKWFTSAVLAYKYKPESRLKSVLDRAVDGLISTQTPDGYIGNYAPDKHLASWDIWGRKYCMLGLLAYYDLTGEQKALTAAKGVADHLIGELNQRGVLIVKMGNHRGMAASSVLEPVCQLYSRTGEKKYLDFAEEIVRQWETPDGPQLISKAGVDVSRRFPKPIGSWYGWEQGQKAYEMMSCYEGLLELYRLTGRENYKTAAEKTWQNILEKEMNIVGSGSAMEAWFDGKSYQTMPVSHYQETCVTVTWVKLSQQLLRLTGDARYADAIEQTFYNSLLGSMSADGSDWAKYTPLAGQRLEGSEQCGMGLNCCNASGPRGLFTIPLTVVMQSSSGLQVNFYVPGSYSVITPGRQNAEIIQETDYPVSGRIRLRVSLPRPEEMTVKVRIPAWSNESSVTVNGTASGQAEPGHYMEVKRRWTNGDVVELNLDMRAKLKKQGDLPENLAIVRGPVVLTRDERLPGPGIEAILRPVAGKDGYVNLEPAGESFPEIWMAFKASFVPESYREGGSKPIEVLLCDYASAGNARDHHPFFRVWLPQLLHPQHLGRE